LVVCLGSVSTGPKEAKPNAPYTVIMEVSDTHDTYSNELNVCWICGSQLELLLMG